MVAIATITPLPWLRAQEPAVPPAVVGQRVRVRHCEGRRCTAVTGILRDVGTDGLRIEVVPDSVPVVPWQAVQRLDRSVGRHRRPLGGLLIGAGVGLGAGLFTGAVVSGGLVCGYDVDCAELIAFSGAMGVLAGAVVGVGIGAVVRTESWARIPVTGAAVMPVGRRGRIGFVVRSPF
jgi:hypothetical protein